MARFELYEDRKNWWWVFFLSVAAAKDKPLSHAILVEMLFDAVEYQSNYSNSLKREGILNKYDIKGTNK